MVVLAASIVTKGGTVLVSRQFVDMPRMRIEGLLNSFPKLVDMSKQHTYIETESVRFVFTPIEDLFLIIITTKNSNMMEDLETLRLLSRCVPEQVRDDVINEETVRRFVFEIIFAFDEVIAPHGYKENLTIQAVKTSLEMDSNEERIAIALRKQKEQEAAEDAKRRQADITRMRKEREASMRAGGRIGMGGMGSGGMGSGGMGGGGGGGRAYSDQPVIQTAPEPAPAPARVRAGGMKLGGKKAEKQGDDLLEQMMAEGSISSGRSKRGGRGGGAGPAAATMPIDLSVNETIDVLMNRDGGLESFEVKGDLSLTVAEEDSAQLQVQLELGENAGFQFKTHPNINKQMYADDNILCLKNPERPFPLNSALGVLRWRMNSSDEGALPLTINCWPSKSGALSYVNIEYELVQKKFELQDVCITIPCPGGCDSVELVNLEGGEYAVDRRNEVVNWNLDEITAANDSGQFEFTVPANDPDSFFPVAINFGSSKTFIDMSIVGATHTMNQSTLRYQSSFNLKVGSYSVGAE